MKELQFVGVSEISALILELREKRVILDKDLALLYGVSTKRLIEQVKRNKERFPSDFMFKLNKEEVKFLRSQFATSSWGGRRYNPYVFTRNGANMVSTILKSKTAIRRSIQIMRAFTSLEEMMSTRKTKSKKSVHVLSKLATNSKAIMYLFQKNKINDKELNKIKEVVKEMIGMLQRMVFRLK